LLALTFTAVTRLVVLSRFTRYLLLSGDEVGYYWPGADRLLDLFKSDQPLSTTVNLIVGRGWFMPGMSLLLTPVRVFTDSVALGRLWIGLANFALFAVLVLVLRWRFGKRAAWVFWAIGTFMPTMVVFSFTFFGEPVAGQMVVLLTLSVFIEAQRRFTSSRVMVWFGVGLGLAILIYIRPSTIVVALIIVVTIVLGGLTRESFWPSVKAALWPSIIVATTSILLLTPWVVAVSNDKGGFFLTTTSLELGQIIGFGDPGDVVAEVEPKANGDPFGVKNTWYQWDAHIEELATDRGITYARALNSERVRIMSAVSPREYFQRSRSHFRAFLFSSSTFLDQFVGLVRIHPDAPLGAYRSLGDYESLSRVTRASWWLMLAATTGFLLWPRRVAAKEAWLYLTVKLIILGTLIQPLVHAANGRHHVVLLPVIAVVIAVGLFGIRDDSPSPASSRSLIFGGQVVIALVTLTGIVVFALG
jgi:hypothetical protein